MTIPTIHLNGTSKDRLVATLCEASQALDLAYSALKQTAPNGRDYYPQGGDAFSNANDEHVERLLKVDSVKKEIDELTLAIDRL